jgi:hypothetical protein
MAYLEQDHWSLYIHEEKQCIYCNFVPRFHNDATSREFAHNICIAWALSRGLNEDDEKIVAFVNVRTIVPRVSPQMNSWECGHHVVLNFKTYL